MAIKIRCSQCNKKVAIDVAFAGGVCRCPYCTALVFVQIDSAQMPEVPRPEAPITAEDAIEAAVGHEIPMADPVRLQGRVTIILIGALFVLAAAGVVMALHLMNVNTPTTPTSPNGAQTPDTGLPIPEPPPEQLGLEGIELDSPIIYCLDTGASMVDVFDYAVVMTRISVRSLKADQKFNILLCTETDGDGYKLLLKDFRPGGREAEKKVAEPLESAPRDGVTDLSVALKAAIAQRPATIVLFARKTPAKPARLGELAKERAVKIITIAVDADEDTRKALAKLAQLSGGQARSLDLRQLNTYIQRYGDMD